MEAELHFGEKQKTKGSLTLPGAKNALEASKQFQSFFFPPAVTWVAALRHELILNEATRVSCLWRAMIFVVKFVESELKDTEMVDVYGSLAYVTVNLQGWWIKATVTWLLTCVISFANVF